MAVFSNSTTAPARPLLPLAAFDRRAINRDGWARARTLAARLGGEIRAHLAEGLRQAWRAARAAVGVPKSGETPEHLLPASTPLPSLSAAPMRRRAISKPAILPAPLPNLRDALARRAAVFGPYDLDEPPAPPMGFLARCAAGLRSAADFLEPGAGCRR